MSHYDHTQHDAEYDESRDRLGRMTNGIEIQRFILAGNAYFTLVGKSERFTYNVSLADKRQPGEADRWFVSVLTRPDEYTYMAMMFDKWEPRWTKGSKVSDSAPSARAFLWFCQQIQKRNAEFGNDFSWLLPDSLEFYHAGKCGRCGRQLTVPESIRNGLGPECAGKV